MAGSGGKDTLSADTDRALIADHVITSYLPPWITRVIGKRVCDVNL